MIRALAFDFDGLILDTETPIVEAWVQVHELAEVAFDRNHVTDIVGHVDVEHDPWVAFGPDADRHELQRRLRKLKNELILQQKILPGVTDYLNQAKRSGLRTAIASNSPHAWVDDHLKRLGLWERFDLVLCRDDVARGKPEPDIYQSVLREFKVEGREVIAFEDSNPGSMAATRAGLWCVAVPNPCTHQHDFAHANLTLPSLATRNLDDLLAHFASAI